MGSGNRKFAARYAGLKTVVRPSFHDAEGEPKVLTYRPLTVGSTWPWGLFYTLVRPKRLAKQLASSIGLAAVLMFTSEGGDAHEERIAAVGNAAVSIRTLVAFCIGGFISQVLGAWKERRRNYASLCGATRNLIIQLGACTQVVPYARVSHPAAQWLFLVARGASARPREALIRTTDTACYAAQVIPADILAADPSIREARSIA